MTATENKLRPAPVKSVGIIGLGDVGRAVGRAFVRMGHGAGIDKIAVFDADASVLSSVNDPGIVACKSVAHLSEIADLVLLSLPKAGDVAKIVRSHEGLLDCARQGQIIIDLSWSAPDLMEQIGTAFIKRGIAFLDAPIGRSPDVISAIETGRLALAIGGDQTAIDAASAALRCFVATITPVGPVGAAQVVRQMSDLVAFQTFTALAEARAVATGFGIDGAMLIKALAEGQGGGAGIALRNFQQFLDTGQGSDGAQTTIEGAGRRLKDAVQLAESKRFSLAGASGTLGLLEKAIEKGLGDDGLKGLSSIIEPEKPEWQRRR